MNINLPEGFNINLRDFLQKQGYSPSPFSGEESYVKRLNRDFYPRFHLYVKNGNLNLHLDQKKASYIGHYAHSGEYDSEIVKKEAEKIKTALSALLAEQIKGFNKSQ